MGGGVRGTRGGRLTNCAATQPLRSPEVWNDNFGKGGGGVCRAFQRSDLRGTESLHHSFYHFCPNWRVVGPEVLISLPVRLALDDVTLVLDDEDGLLDASEVGAGL